MPDYTVVDSFNSSYTIYQQGSNYVAEPAGDTELSSFSGTDVGALINSCIAALGDDGGGIFIRRGTYTVSTKILVNKEGITIRGEGFGHTDGTGPGTTLSLADGVNDDMIYTLNGPYFTLSDITLYGNGANQTAGTGVLNIASYDCSVERVNTTYGYAAGTFINCNLGFGYYINQLYSEYNAGYGIHLANQSTAGDTGGGEGLINMCDVFGNDLGGIRFYGGVQRCTVNHCRFERCTTNGAVGLRMRNNTAAFIPKNNTFVGCYFFQNAQHGITLEGAQYNTFLGCHILDNSQQTDNTYDGVIFQEGENSTYSKHNMFIGTLGYNAQTNDQRYGFNEADTNQDFNFVYLSDITGNDTADFRMQGANSFAQTVKTVRPNAAMFQMTVTGSQGSAATRYDPLNWQGSNNMATADANCQNSINFNFNIIRYTGRLTTNTRDGALTIGFRDDGATVASISWAAGVTGQVDSGALSVAVASGSLCNHIYTLAGTTGAIQEFCIACEYERTA